MYDAVVIGAGIGGLVCGCYLAKAGMKVLICEQHHKPGGYCTSFKRNGFTFDAAAHSFGGYKNGPLGTIFNSLEIDKKIKIKQFNHSDIVVTPDYKISFWDDSDKTVNEFQAAFPKEKNNIKTFFNFLFDPNPNSFSRIRRWTFKDLLDNYFTDEKLKAILAFPLFGNGGLPPSLMSAFIGAKIFREYLLDGGYYPEDSMQTLPDALVKIFKEAGGELRLSCLVNKIKVTDNKSVGVILENNEYITSKYVVSNCDARQTFLNLLGEDIITEEIIHKVNNMLPSLSIFILYLGIDEAFDSLSMPGTNVWILSNYDLEKTYLAATKVDIANMNNYMLRLSPDRKTILAFFNIAFKNKAFWTENKQQISDIFIRKIENDMISNLSKHIVFKEAATPYTLHRYTLNYNGAAYGWACTPSQLADPIFKKPSFIQNLYLSGHWTTQGLGIPGVVYVGYDTAKMILKRDKGKHCI